MRWLSRMRQLWPCIPVPERGVWVGHAIQRGPATQLSRAPERDRALFLWRVQALCAPGRAATMAALRLSMSQGASPAARRAAAAPLRAGDPRRSSAGSGLGMKLEYECPIAATLRPAPAGHAGGASASAGARRSGARGWGSNPITRAGGSGRGGEGGAAPAPQRLVGEKRGCSSAR